MTRRLATVPLKETHAFATVPAKDGKSYSMYISAAGDWTRNLIDDPPKNIWMKGRPVYAELVLDGPDQFRPWNWSTSSQMRTGPVRTGRTGRTGY
ncbi:hypothetical protein KCV03_g9335, partial [Aureobasidium melanogenum]